MDDGAPSDYKIQPIFWNGLLSFDVDSEGSKGLSFAMSQQLIMHDCFQSYSPINPIAWLASVRTLPQIMRCIVLLFSLSAY